MLKSNAQIPIPCTVQAADARGAAARDWSTPKASPRSSLRGLYGNLGPATLDLPLDRVVLVVSGHL